MNTQELKQYIDRILGNNIRCLLPSYWWKRAFGAVIDKVDEKVDGSNLKTINGESIIGTGNLKVGTELRVITLPWQPNVRADENKLYDFTQEFIDAYATAYPDKAETVRSYGEKAFANNKEVFQILIEKAKLNESVEVVIDPVDAYKVFGYGIENYSIDFSVSIPTSVSFMNITSPKELKWCTLMPMPWGADGGENEFCFMNHEYLYLMEDGSVEYKKYSAGSSGGITVDSELSETSENPVQNKAVYAALEEIRSEGVFVETPKIEAKNCTTYNELAVALENAGIYVSDDYEPVDALISITLKNQASNLVPCKVTYLQGMIIITTADYTTGASWYIRSLVGSQTIDCIKKRGAKIDLTAGNEIINTSVFFDDDVFNSISNEVLTFDVRKDDLLKSYEPLFIEQVKKTDTNLAHYNFSINTGSKLETWRLFSDGSYEKIDESENSGGAGLQYAIERTAYLTETKFFEYTETFDISDEERAYNIETYKMAWEEEQPVLLSLSGAFLFQVSGGIDSTSGERYAAFNCVVDYTKEISSLGLASYTAKVYSNGDISIIVSQIQTGGGAPDEIYIGEEEPTDENVKVWINPNEQGDSAGNGGSEFGVPNILFYYCIDTLSDERKEHNAKAFQQYFALLGKAQVLVMDDILNTVAPGFGVLMDETSMLLGVLDIQLPVSGNRTNLEGVFYLLTSDGEVAPFE